MFPCLVICFIEGKIYDREDPVVVQPHIQSFIETYEIDTSELLQQDIKAYKVGFASTDKIPATNMDCV